LSLQQEGTRKQEVGTAGREGLHAYPQRRQCPHERTVTRARSPIVVRSGDWPLILKDELGSSRRDAKIAPAGDDVDTLSWDLHQP
jgi:hypothetical protein